MLPEPTEQLRCLWVSRYVPYPLDAGAKVYSARLAEALAASGASVSGIGYGEAQSGAARASRVRWIGLDPARRRRLSTAFSRLPYAASSDATPEYRSCLARLLAEGWDAVVLDGYGTGWALEMLRAPAARAPLLVHVSHNHEVAVWREMGLAGVQSLHRRMLAWQNYLKVRALERRIVSGADLLTAITDEDRQAFAVQSPRTPLLTLTPGYDGGRVAARRIAADTPRRVLLVGSYRWVVKSENLRRFLATADELFARNSIALDVVGDLDPALRAQLQSSCRATTFHGFVDDLAPFLANARMAVVPEQVGGGFKLKLLDYVFGRVPVVALRQALMGLPPELRRQVICSEDMSDLARAVVAGIDDLSRLNALQEAAFAAARERFSWEHRGGELLLAMRNLLRARRATVPATAAHDPSIPAAAMVPRS